MSKQLVIQIARLGDIIQTKRLMLSLKEEGELALLVDKNLMSFAQSVYPYATIFGVHINNSDPNMVFQENILLFSALKNENFDVVYAINYSAFSQKICMLFEPYKLRGYGRVGSNMRQSTWVRLAFRWMKDRRVTPLNLMDYWANFAPNPIAATEVNPIAKAGGKGIGIALAGQDLRRSLTPKEYAKVIHAIYEREKNRIGIDQLIFLGTEAEAGFAKELLFALPIKLQEKVQNLAGKTNLEELSQKLVGLDLLLSPDTGIAHIAAHLGVPVEAFYLSSANCFETGPYGLGHTVWQASMKYITQTFGENEKKISVNCSPCTEAKNCPYTPNPDTKKQDVSLLPCHKAFQTPAFLMRLDKEKYTEKTLEKHPLENIILYSSSFNEYNQSDTAEKNSLGLTWQGAQKPSNKQVRQDTRDLLHTYIVATKKSDYHANIDISPVFDQTLFDESNWIFPIVLP